ncbi:MAG: CbtA family protein [Candidatus Solibacter usitatus]|nr:CbtA family protein [Candidatus Solibacter usitatus]
MSQFRKLLLVSLASGALAGLVWFGAQYFAVIPLIETAESYEAAAHQGHPHEGEGWRPANGWQRTSSTALATILTGIGFAAILFGWVAVAGRPLDARRGALWGLAAFVCFGLAPALGLPPQPPGVAVADLTDRQLWWAGTVIATAIGLYLIAAPSGSWLWRLGGVVCLALPHAVGAPIAAGENLVPAHLVRQFTLASLATTGLFWLTLGASGGFLFDRYQPMALDKPLRQTPVSLP